MNASPNNSRRDFIRSGIAAIAISATPSVFGQDVQPKVKAAKREDPIGDDLVHKFVVAAHGKTDEVKRLLAESPRIANATWDWGNGDFETALGGSAHMGRTEIAKILVDAGARKDVFCYAMEGNLNVVKTIIEDDPSTVNLRGPHGISLIYHVALSANIDLANVLKSSGAKADDRSLNASINIARDYEMTEWLLDNGAVYSGQKGLSGKTLADEARMKNLNQIADLLEKRMIIN